MGDYPGISRIEYNYLTGRDVCQFSSGRFPFQYFPLFVLSFYDFVAFLVVCAGIVVYIDVYIENQAVTFIVMLGIIGTLFFYVGDNLYGVFDFFGVNIPAIFLM